MKTAGTIAFWMIRISVTASLMPCIISLFDESYRLSPILYLLVTGILTFILWKAKYTES